MSTAPWARPNGQTAPWERPAPAVPAPPPPSMLQDMLTGAGDFSIGAGKGLLHTLYEIGAPAGWAAQKLGLVKSETPQEQARQEALFNPSNTAQSLGRSVEQAGEFLVPGGLEEEGALKLADLLPNAGKLAKPLARIAMSALGSGAVNAAQGGSPLTGAEMGAGGAAAGELLRPLAPSLMEWAQGLKTPGRKTGQALLDETSSVLPGGVRRQARSVLDTLNPQLNAVTEASPAMISLKPAREAANEQLGRAMGKNNPRMVKGVRRMANQLFEQQHAPLLGAEGPSGLIPIPDEVPATQFRRLKQGIGEALPAGSWSPESSNAFRPARNAIYGKMNESFENAVPEAAPLNRRISALIPATEEPAHSWGHAWGPGAGAMIGGFYGARPGIREGNPLQALTGMATGAAEGGLAGFAAPTAVNATARALASPALRNLVTGTALQTTRKKKER